MYDNDNGSGSGGGGGGDDDIYHEDDSKECNYRLKSNHLWSASPWVCCYLQ